MTEIILTSVIDKLVQLLIEETKLFKGAHKEVKNLKNELELLNSLFKDADTKKWVKGNHSESFSAWFKQLKEVAYHIEDVIDEYLLHVANNHQRCRRGIFLGFLHNISHKIKALKLSYNMASQIQNIQASLRKIKDRGETYGLSPFDQQGVVSRGMKDDKQHHHDPRLGALFVEENELVGIDTKRDDLLRMLLGGDSIRTVISLVGKGGIGKTTLAKKVYENEDVQARFDFQEWISVSQSYNIKKILKSIAMQICPAALTEFIMDEMDILPKLIGTLRQFLETKRYVIVFDDIWDMDFWNVMKLALPSNDKGSRIIITTRNDNIAASCKEHSSDFVLKIEPLSQEMAWELFCKKAFRFQSEKCCPQELEELSLKIVKKCQGLPLVVATIGALLSTKEKVVYEWQNLHDSLESEFETNPHLSSVQEILSLSYDDLPYHLKSCFLYFGMFPEDYAIENLTLCRLWIAEGFVQKQRDRTLEQVAEEYLKELINRNLIQTWVDFYASTKLCRVHDLMHEIILSRVNQFGFCQSVGRHENDLRSREKYRRLSIYNTTNNVLKNVENFQGVRSVFLFNIDKLEDINVDLIRKFKLLKVLDFSNAPLCYLPKEVGKLSYLKYISLRNTKLKMLPKFIGKLQSLQTLDIRETSILDLPIEINNLRNLQCIAAFSYGYEVEHSLKATRGVKIHEGLLCLEDLQTLLFVDAYRSGTNAIKELENLKKLKMLGITNLSAETAKTLCPCIEKMNHLDMLCVYSINEDEVLDVQNISSPPCFLTQLFLMGKLLKLPEWIKKVQNLRRLALNFSRLTDDPLKVLKHLRYLEFLDMYQAYEGEELHFQEGSFQKLKQLTLEKLDGLKALKIDERALPVLEDLFIGLNPLMKEVPSDIKHLGKLKFLKLYDMPKEFVLGMQPGEGRDYWKVEHVACAIFCYTVAARKYESYKLGDSELLQRLQG
ncbi:disease resistance protein RPM1-like [Ziziphus jujuba]|uniref:Disease resistance protein RPM1-like n=1 Tax=Ziziphus jujuba TaxID=326968 RepID=A0ABM4A9B2_ZIZJJ|nr:disease resistance protein RPM1-like [Ziziphus jujuba]